jgi:hypothetical protein
MWTGAQMKVEQMDFAVPEGWVFEGSLSQRFTFVSSSDAPERLKFLRADDGIDVHLDTETDKLDTETDKEVFIAMPIKR